ncbi:hypothetical protein ABZT26_25790 [Streptomyces sp. NPDC005395]|uniref:hypothetical protein n=1 Tax=Streptomyces sp. NPDC005395 TaxID=3157042 RepID=UPI0033B187F3
MRQMLYGQMEDGRWEFHGDPSCATREKRERPEAGWRVTLKTYQELAEDLRSPDAMVGESTSMVLCSCLGAPGGRRPMVSAPGYEPEW